MSAMERQIKEGLAIERESKKVDILMNGKGEWGINVVPRLQTEKDRLGIISESSQASTSNAGKRQAEVSEDQPTGTHSTIHIANANAELAFSDQFRQRKRAKRNHKATKIDEGITRSMITSSAQGMTDQQWKGRSSQEPSGLVIQINRMQTQRKGNLQDEPSMEVKGSRTERPKD